ncbi:hypothetical protein HS7_15650 [Sulfolobales archaeon HS-7]|nr:hypothetical protein HS7_15650 [Sulfolobales archaeon HS-7]
MDYRNSGIHYLILASLLWGTIGIVVQETNSPFVEAFIRSLTGGIVGIVILKDRRNIFSKDLILLGIATTTIFEEIYMYSITVIGASLSAVMLYTAPIWIFFLAKTKRIAMIIPTVMVLIGAYLVMDVPAITVEGVALGLLSGLTYALLIVHSNSLQKKGFKDLEIIAISLLWASLSSAPLSVLYPDFSVSAIAAGIYLGLVSSLIAYLLFFAGMKRSGPLVASIASSLEPVFTIVLAWPILGDRLNLTQLIGCALIVVSMILVRT